MENILLVFRLATAFHKYLTILKHFQRLEIADKVDELLIYYFISYLIIPENEAQVLTVNAKHAFGQSTIPFLKRVLQGKGKSSGKILGWALAKVESIVSKL